MARMTHDAVAIQAAIGRGDTFEIPALAEQVFGSTTKVTLMRVQRAARVLAELGRAEITVDRGRVSSITSKEAGHQHLQLSAVMRRFADQNAPAAIDTLDAADPAFQPADAR